MKIEQFFCEHGNERRNAEASVLGAQASLVLAFGGRSYLETPRYYNMLRERYPAATILIGSTAGEIMGTSVRDNSLVVTAVSFEYTTVEGAIVSLSDYPDSRTAGEALGYALPHRELAHVFVISDGQKVNGSALVSGLRSAIPARVAITGGLAGDDNRFRRTLVGLDQPPAEGRIAAVGFYGTRLHSSYGWAGGWAPFGPKRLITRSLGNTLYELDGKPALELYTRYLGSQANALPGSALLLPLSIAPSDNSAPPAVRTVLSINNSDQSMTFAGNIPEGWYGQLMRTSAESLIDSAALAAGCSLMTEDCPPELALLVSCVGRKTVLGQRVEEEVESVREVLGPSTALAGFYSYGEISALASSTANVSCELHNQTMTMTGFREL